jgi:hypothetical protein
MSMSQDSGLVLQVDPLPVAFADPLNLNDVSADEVMITGNFVNQLTSP